MYISPTKAIENNWITGNITEQMIQPNGIDFTLDKLFGVTKDSPSFVLTDTTKRHRTFEQIEPYGFHIDSEIFQGFRLEANKSYDFISNLKINLPINVCAMIIGRSTLNRNGVFLTSGWWDSGYHGFIGGQIHNLGGPSVMEQGCRIGQIIFAEAAATSKYAGSYNEWSR